MEFSHCNTELKGASTLEVFVAFSNLHWNELRIKQLPSLLRSSIFLPGVVFMAASSCSKTSKVFSWSKF